MIPLVDGDIEFEGEPSFSDATLYVRLEDVSEADAPAKVVSEYVRRGVTVNPETAETVTFTLTGEAPDPTASYSVRAHLDVDGDGQVSAGDFISTQSYPVLTSGHPSRVSVLVRPVR